MSTTHDIPGGTATFREQSELSERQKRAVMRASTLMPSDAITAPAIAVDGEVVDGDAQSVSVRELSGAELDGMWSFADQFILAYLESWTLDRPLPKTDDDLLDLPGDLYDALQAAIANVQKSARKPDGFGPDSAMRPDGSANTDSPTGA